MKTMSQLNTESYNLSLFLFYKVKTPLYDRNRFFQFIQNDGNPLLALLEKADIVKKSAQLSKR